MQNPLPPVIHALRALSRILDKAEAHAAQKRIAPATLLNDRLYPDMLPLVRQVQIATDHAKAMGARLSGIENPRLEDDETEFAQLGARIGKVIEFLSAIPEEAFAAADEREIAFRLAGRDVSFTGGRYLDYFARPNFYFHMTTAYNILRHNGVEIGKADFLGA